MSGNETGSREGDAFQTPRNVTLEEYDSDSSDSFFSDKQDDADDDFFDADGFLKSPGGAPRDATTGEQACASGGGSTSAVHDSDAEPVETDADPAQSDPAERTLTDEERSMLNERATAAKVEGNEHYRAQRYDEALQCYERALEVAPADDPDRAVYYFNCAAVHEKKGELDEVIKACTNALSIRPEYAKALARRSTAYESQDKIIEASDDMKRACEIEPSNSNYRMKHSILEPRAAAKRKAEMDEMMGKLKDLGNSILGKFGLSLDNFKMEKDANSGSYNLSMNK